MSRGTGPPKNRPATNPLRRESRRRDSLQEFLQFSDSIVRSAVDRRPTARRRTRKAVPTGGRSIPSPAFERRLERYCRHFALGPVASCPRAFPETGGDSRRVLHCAIAGVVLHSADVALPFVRKGHRQRLWHVLSRTWKRQPAGQPVVGDTLRRLRSKPGELQIPELSRPLLHALRRAGPFGGSLSAIAVMVKRRGPSRDR